MIVRIAADADAEAIADILRRSIRELCVLDHKNEECALTQWLGNKTAATVASWIRDPAQHIIVVEEDCGLIGVGGASSDGKVTLNYVAPEARFQGVSRMILAALETHIRSLGLAQSTLSSTRTALPFYKSAGYTEAGEPEVWGRLAGQPMRKALR